MAPQVYIFIGASGSGKGTQVDLLKKYLEENSPRKVLSFTTGQSFRKLAEDNSYTAKLVDKALSEGGLVPIFLPVWAWSGFLVENYTGEEHVIFDGLARREEEAPILDSAMEFYGIPHVNVIYINVSDEWAKERLFGRGREDDGEKEIEKRLAWFKENTMKSIEYFKEYEKSNFFDINGEQTIEEVHKSIIQALGFEK